MEVCCDSPGLDGGVVQLGRLCTCQIGRTISAHHDQRALWVTMRLNLPRVQLKNAATHSSFGMEVNVLPHQQPKIYVCKIDS